jgi:hypothetical protein
VTTVIAIVTLIKRKRTGWLAPLATLLTWIAIAVSLVVNAFVLLYLVCGLRPTEALAW